MPATESSRPRARRTRRLLGVLAATGVLLAGGLPAQASALHPGPRGGYVALGDSYASGEGLAPYDADGGTCDRSSSQSYPDRLEQAGPRSFNRLTSLACQGAGTLDVVGTQVPLIDPRTKTITLTVGGNDIGFGPVIASCLYSPDAGVQATLPGGAGCAAVLDPKVAAPTALLGGALANGDGRLSMAAVIAAVAARAPRATILVSGYPQLFSRAEAPCQVTASAPIYIAADDVNWIRDKTARLDAAIHAGVDQARAAGANVAYVDPTPIFTGHGVCDPKPWIIGLVLDPGAMPPVGQASFHPTKIGQIAYAVSFVLDVDEG